MENLKHEKLMLRGLTTAEAEKRQKQYGLNEIIKKNKISPIRIFLSQFNDFITWVLLGATVISGIMGDTADAITICIIVILNAILGFIQEFKTEKSLDALQSMASPTCKVFRDNNVKVINANEVTIGDIIILEAGDRIPADGEIVECNNFVIDESILTGESVGVTKSINRGSNYAFMGTTVIKGKGCLKVNQIAMDTEMGKIANMLDNIEVEKSPLKEKLEGLGKVLVVACLIVCALVTVLGVIRGNPIGDMFLLGVSLAVAAIPEGLTAIVTVALALGVSRMLNRKALVRKLPAVETLGCTSVICSDKTGTLTQNNMTAKEVFVDGRFFKVDQDGVPENNKLMKSFVYCNDCSYDFSETNIERALHGDPTETALIKLYFKDVARLEKATVGINRVFDIPFDSSRKMMSVVVKEAGREVAYVKGAPERLIDKCTHILENGTVKLLTFQKKKQIADAMDNMSRRALRCIGGAYKESGISKNESLESDLIFVGFVGIIDPPRKEVKDAVLKCKLAGIKPVMITGDHKNTAYAIGRELGITNSESQVITGEQLEKMSDKELKAKVENIRIFARVTPTHKLRIVRAFKKNGNIVAMTGDGVNDAPALKRADVGFAMGSGTDVAKEVGDIVILDDNFKSIENAILYGRTIYNNILKFIKFQLTINVAAVAVCAIGPFIGVAEPLSITHILWINLIMDGLGALALGSEPALKSYMKEKPKSRSQSIVSKDMMGQVLVSGAWLAVLSIVFLKLPLFVNMFENQHVLTTAYFSLFVFVVVFNGFNVRTDSLNITSGLKENMSFVKVMGIILVVQVIITYIGGDVFNCYPFEAKYWLLILVLALTIIPIDMIRKTVMKAVK